MTKTLTLTNTQFAMLQALLNSEAFGTDLVQDAMGEAAAVALGTDSVEATDATIDAEIDLQNSLTEALLTPIGE